MNTERYILPVVIAAGLHGALLLSFVDSIVVYPSQKPKDGPVEKPPVIDWIRVPPENPTPVGPGETAGGPAPLITLPDIPMELPKDTEFTVKITERIVPLNPVDRLPPGELIGPGDGPPGITGVPNAIDLDRVPRVMVQPSPNYPHTMRKDGINGSVTVEFVVDTTGRVVSADAVRWSHREFVEPAVQAVLRWRFEPGKLDGRPVRFRMAVPIEFTAER